MIQLWLELVVAIKGLHSSREKAKIKPAIEELIKG